MTQKVQTEKLNAKQNIKRGAVGQSGSTTTNPWYKFASCTVSGAHEDRWITFAVTTGYGDASNTIGILTAHFRTNSTKVWESGELKWQVAGSGIDPTKFVIAYKNTANTSCAVELWAKIDSAYRYYHFDVISEGNRSAFGDYWTLHNLSAAGSAAAPSTGFTQVASTVLALKNTAVYTHPTSAGNKHIPAGGSAGQILKWNADGTAVWGAYDLKKVTIPASGSSWTDEGIGCYSYKVPASDTTGLSTSQALFITVSCNDLFVSQEVGFKLIACNYKGRMSVFVNKLPKNSFNLLYIPVDIVNSTMNGSLWSNVITF